MNNDWEGERSSDDSDSGKKQGQQKTLTCDICSKQYKSVFALKRHSKTHFGRYKCDLCDVSYMYAHRLNSHKTKVHGVETRRRKNITSFSCDLCPSTFNRLYNLNRHYAATHGHLSQRERRGIFQCRYCESDFADYSELFRHVNENHPLQQGGREESTQRSLYDENERDRKALGTNNVETNESKRPKLGQQSNEPMLEQSDDTTQSPKTTDQSILHNPVSEQMREPRGARSKSPKANDQSALNNAVQNRNIYPDDGDQYDVLTFFANNRDRVRTFLQNRAMELGGIKWNLCVQVEMRRDEGHRDQVVTPYFRSLTYITLTNDDWNEHNLNEALRKMFASLEKFMREGSGWYVEKVLKLEIHTIIYKPAGGSTYIPLPISFARSRSLLNIQNDDEKCFLYCLLAHLYPAETEPEKVDHYLQHEHRVNMTDIAYPITLPQIRRVEKQNEHISINVFTHEDDSIVPLRITEYRHRPYHINLFLLTNGERSHYCLIKSLNRFLSRTKKENNTMFFCCYCLHGFCKETALQNHQPYCMPHGAQRVELPVPGENDVLKFKDFEKTLRVPFVIYADFETVNRKFHTCAPNPKHSISTVTSKLDVCSFGYKVVCENKKFDKPTVIYRGEDAGHKLLECLLREEKEIQEILSSVVPMDITREQSQLIEKSTNCCLCKKRFGIFAKSNGNIVRHHNHLTGEFIGLACNSCNLACRQVKFVPVIFHNLKNFDAHILCENLGHFKDHRLTCIAQNTERYVSFSLGRLRFVDSFQFNPTSLNNLVSNLASEGLESFPYLLAEFGSREKAELLQRKGVYPYEYVDSFDKFNERNLPPKERFYSTLTKEHISQDDYNHALNVFETFNMTSLGQYHDLYLKTDVVLLCDVFESFRKVCLTQYELDPCHFYTSPGLAWSSLLKMTRIELQLISNIDILLLCEVGLRGGLSQVSHRYKRCNNPYLEDYDPSKTTSYIQYLDANNLYGWAMTQPLPVGNFKFMEERDIEHFDVMSVSETGQTGYIVEVSLRYPEELHDMHNCLPLAPERKVISNDQLSPYAQRLLRKLYNIPENDPLPSTGQVGKLLATLNDKNKYVVHYRNLQLYVNLGMEIKQIHRVLQFHQKAWMKPYIDFNTEKRKEATSDFQKHFYKLMNVSVFGKTMENVRQHRNIELVHTKERLQKCTAKPTYKNTTIFTEDLVAVELYKAKVNLFKPIYCGMCILDLSKSLMYDFWYNYIKRRYGDNAQLLMTDTDSLLFFCQTEDIYKDMETAKDLFDTSEYADNHFLHSERNKKVLGKMKDETKGNPISEFVGLRSKMYSFKCNNKEEKRAKGISTVTVKNELKHEHYKNILSGETRMASSMSSLRSRKHQLFGEDIQKISLSSFDDKRYLIDALNSYAYGHYKIGDNDNDTNRAVVTDNQGEISVIQFKRLEDQTFLIDGVEITPCELL